MENQPVWVHTVGKYTSRTITHSTQLGHSVHITHTTLSFILTMSENEPQVSDAEKMRLKRLARLGGPATTTQAPPTPVADQPSEPHQPQPGPSAASRLLNTSIPVQATTPKPSPAPKASTSSIPAARPSKRPSPTSTRVEPAAAPAARKPPPPARLPVPYSEWEAQRIQGVFSVTLSVSLSKDTLLTTAR